MKRCAPQEFELWHRNAVARSCSLRLEVAAAREYTSRQQYRTLRTSILQCQRAFSLQHRLPELLDNSTLL